MESAGAEHVDSYLYSAYGLLIASNEPIPYLRAAASGGDADLTLFQRREPEWLPDVLAERREPWSPTTPADPEIASTRWMVGESGSIHVTFGDGTRFVLNASTSEIWTDWIPPYRATDMATYFVGPILGFILAMRGITVLHASVICIDDVALAIVGPCGSGKSTTAAAFAVRGEMVLTEDVAALQERDSTILVQPGYPTVRLWPESVEMLFSSVDSLPRLTPGWDKRNLEVGVEGRPFAGEAKELAAVYYLAGRTDDPLAPSVERMSQVDGLITLVGNTYTHLRPRFDTGPDEFKVLSRVAAAIPMRRVITHSDPSRLNDLCEVIERDFRTLPRLETA